jgi:hypothetical protein
MAQCRKEERSLRNPMNRTQYLDKNPLLNWVIFNQLSTLVAGLWAIYAKQTQSGSDDHEKTKRTHFYSGHWTLVSGLLMQNKPKLQLGGTFKRSLWVPFTKQTDRLYPVIPNPLAGEGPMDSLSSNKKIQNKAKLCPFHSKIKVSRKNKPNFHVAQPPSAVSKLRKTNPKSKRSGDPP